MKIISKAKQNSELSVTLDDFSKLGAYFENFRSTRDLSLCKRNGYSKLLDLSVSPSGVYIDGSDASSSLHVLCGSYLSGIDLVSVRENTPSGVDAPDTCVPSSAASYRGDALILDGERILKKDSDGQIRPLSAYVPLCANMWENDKKGEIFESLNCLSNHFRASYKVNGAPDRLYLPFNATRIDCITHNGYPLDENDYNLAASGAYVSCGFGEENGFIVVYASVDESFVTDSLVSKCRAVSVSDRDGAEVYLFSPSVAGQENLFFRSSIPDPSSIDPLTYSLYGVNSDLCFFEDSRSRLSSGKDIRAIKYVSDKVLFFTDDECYVSKDGESPSLLHAGFGACSNSSVTLCGSYVASVCRNGVYLIRLAERSENTVFERIVTPTDVKVPDGFFEGASVSYDPAKNEIFIYSKVASTSLVYSFDTKITSHFCGFHADVMFFFGTKTYFIDGRTLFAFSDVDFFDSPDGDLQIPVTASFESRALDLGEPFAEKKCSSLSLKASGEHSLNVRLVLDSARSFDLSFKGKEGTFPHVLTRKLPPHRFHSLRICISDKSESKMKLHALGISSRLCKQK